MSSENVLIALTFSAAFVYLTARLVAMIWGVPRLAPRLRSLLQLNKEPPRLTHPARSVDVWALLVILSILELTVARMLADAVSSRDAAGAALTICHFVIVFAWLFYLSRVTSSQHLMG